MTQPAALPVTDRLGTSLAAITRAQVPRLPFFAVSEYAVVSVTPGPPVLIDCQAIDPDELLSLPPTLVGLTLWPGPSGFVAVPVIGSTIRVQFLNGDPSRPVVVGLDPNIQPTLVFGYVNGTMQLGDIGAQPLAHASWLTYVAAAVEVFAAAIGTTPTLPGIVAAANALVIALSPPAYVPSPTVKVLGT